MSSEFLKSSSSPSRDEEDDDHHKKEQSTNLMMMATQTPLHNKVSSSFPLIKSQQSQNQNLNQNQQQQQYFNVTASASKYLNQPLNLSGWTPLVSKTYTNEQILSFNSTPNKLLLQPSTSINNTNNNSSNNNNNNLSTVGVNDLDFQGLGLTPFLNHHINLLGSASSLNQFSGLTPYHEKIFHNSNDFYIDSPSRFGNTLNNEIQAITPSKFSLNTVANKKILQDPLKSSTKRSIALLDTPPRQPHKLSISIKADKVDKDNETDDENEINSGSSSMVNNNINENDNDVNDEEDEDNDEEDEDEDEAFDKRALLQTPSKVLKDITNKPKIEFQTPAKQKLVAPSSPSTIILSSPTRGSSVKPKRVSLIGKENGSSIRSMMMSVGPSSPTPAKNIPITPVMGVFSEKKTTTSQKNDSVSKPSKSSQSQAQPHVPSQSQSSQSAHNSQSKSSSSNKPKSKSKPKQKNKSVITSNEDVFVDDSKRRAANKAKMQAGMNKFQIVLTDVHTLVNSKKKKSKDESKNKTEKKPVNKQSSNSHHHHHHHHQHDRLNVAPPQPQPQPSSSSSSTSSSQQQLQSHPHPQAPAQLNPQSSTLNGDHNITMNTTKEHSSIISGGSNTMNTSHLNMTTDHSSFELGGHYASTPNSKFLLDKIFEKTSPQSNYFINQQQHMIQISQQQQQQQHMIQALQQAQNQSSQDGSMPPPLPTTMGSTSSNKQTIQYLTPQQQQQQSQQQQQQIAMMSMTMSTPQHHGIINYNPQIYVSGGSGDENTSPNALYAYGTTASMTPQGISIYQNNTNQYNNLQRQHQHQHQQSTYDDSIE